MPTKNQATKHTTHTRRFDEIARQRVAVLRRDRYRSRILVTCDRRRRSGEKEKHWSLLGLR